MGRHRWVDRHLPATLLRRASRQAHRTRSVRYTWVGLGSPSRLLRSPVAIQTASCTYGITKLNQVRAVKSSSRLTVSPTFATLGEGGMVMLKSSYLTVVFAM